MEPIRAETLNHTRFRSGNDMSKTDDMVFVSAAMKYSEWLKLRKILCEADRQRAKNE